MSRSQKYIAAGSLFFLSVFLSFSTVAYGANSLKNEAVLKSQSQDSLAIFDKAIIGSSADKKARYVPGEVIVKFKAGEAGLSGQAGLSKAKNFASANNLSLKENVEKQNISVFKINDSQSVESAVQELKKDSSVEYAQPNFIYYPSEISSNDTYKNLLWGMDNTGQTVNGITGTPDADIDAPEAWAINEGTNTSTIVAVLDTGVAYNHPDLAANMWDGTNCKDENGVFLGGCKHGYDYLAGDKDPLPIESSHGTHVAGTIAAAKGNGRGVIGVAPNAKIMAVKVGEESLSDAAILNGIAFAEQNGAKIINASWGEGAGSCAGAYDEALYQAIQGFSGLFVTAAGNDAKNHNGSSYFGIPADFGHTASCWTGLDNVISVAATNADDGLASFSDYGSNFIDVGAPGVNTYSTVAYYYSTLLNEDFEETAVPNIPAGWTREGTVNNWRTASVSGSKVLYADQSFPYADNATSSITSPAYDLSSSTAATIGFSISCDTVYLRSGWGDYLSVFLSSNGTDFIEKWPFDEALIDMYNSEDPYSSSSAALMHYSSAIDSNYLTSNFKIRFGWTSDGSDNNYDGCWIDNLNVSKITESLDGTNGGYDYMSGTSMATPHVVGLAALIWGDDPALTAAQVKSIILGSGDSLASLDGKTITGKRINAYNSAFDLLNPVVGYESDNVIPTSSIRQAPDGTGLITVNFKVKDGIAGVAETLSDFGYSIDGGSTWKTPTSGDASLAFSNNWTNNGYAAATDYSSSSYSFAFNSKYSDFADLNNAQQDNVKIKFKAGDGAKTSGYAVSGVFAIDNLPLDPPTIDDPATTTYINAASYHVTGSASAGYTVFISRVGGDIIATSTPTSTVYGFIVSLDQNATNTFRVFQKDGLGNQSPSVDSAGLIEDSNVPFLSLSGIDYDFSSPYNTTNTTPQVTFSATDTSPTLDCRYDTVDAAYSAMSALNDFSMSRNSSTSIILPDQGEDGSKAVYISCKDLAGNENSAGDNLDVAFVLDTVAPTAVLSNLPVSGTTSGSANITVGGTGVVSYKYKIDSGSYGGTPISISSHIVLSLGTGSHTLSVIGSDEAGNWQTSASSTDYVWTISSSGSEDTCSPAEVSHGTVADYPDCTITCSSGYYKSGNTCVYSGGGGGGGGGDYTAPTISNIVATPTSGTTATVTWQTNEGSLSWILYGTTTAYGQQVKTSSYIANHSVALTGLTASTAYHYQVKSQDSSSNVGIAADKTFTTLVAGATALAPTSTVAVSTTTASISLILITPQKPLNQMTRDELISFILQIIISLQSKSQAVGASVSSPVSSSNAGQVNTAGIAGIPVDFVFKTNLKFGDNSADVRYLQVVLNSDPATRIAAAGFGSPGYETIHFGLSTLAAVKKFQLKYRSELMDPFGLASPAGEVGDNTRAKLNSLLGK